MGATSLELQELLIRPRRITVETKKVRLFVHITSGTDWSVLAAT